MLTLLYHNILNQPDNEFPVASYQVTIDIFRRHLERFRKHLLHPLEAHDDLIRGKPPKGVLITFDDGASGILEAGSVLADFGLHGVAFICPGALESGLWFYRLADSLVRTESTILSWQDFSLSLQGLAQRGDAYHVLSQLLFNFPQLIRDSYLEEIILALSPLRGPRRESLMTLNENQLFVAAKTGGLIFANHSWSHPNLVTLSQDDLSFEIEMAQSWLEKSVLPVLPWFAFPRGRYNSSVIQVVSRFCPIVFSADPSRTNKLVWPRVPINSLDADPVRLWFKTAFQGQLFGKLIYPIKAALYG